MTHDYHQDLDGYDQRQVLHDHCAECESRGESPERALAHMDDDTFAHAWQRAADWQRGHNVGRISEAEAGVLRVLFGVRVRLDRASATTIPMGRCRKDDSLHPIRDECDDWTLA